MKQKRERLELIRDILNAIREKNGKIKPTHIMYKANLSHQMLDEYLTYLKEKEFIEETVKGRNKTYALTEKGFDYMGKYTVITSFIESFGLD